MRLSEVLGGGSPDLIRLVRMQRERRQAFTSQEEGS